MSGVVCFTTANGAWAVPVEHTRRVLSARGLVPLPHPRPGVAGVLPDEDTLTVLDALGEGREQVLELEVDGRRFGLLVDRVVEVLRADQALTGPAPEGQGSEVVSGVVIRNDGNALLIDGAALARFLSGVE